MDIGLALQGGGALGAYEWGAVARLVEAGLRPVAIAGVSIGAINAAAIAGAREGDIVESLNQLWQSITLPAMPFVSPRIQAQMSMLGLPNFFQPRLDYWHMPAWDSLYSVAPMYATLDTLIDWERLNDPALQRVTVTATRVEDGAGVHFSNVERRLDARHILASGSLPPGFPMTEIDGHSYMDGGIFSNTPLPQLLEMLDEDQLDSLPIFVINLFPILDDVPGTLFEIQNRVKEITYENRIEADFGGAEALREHGQMVRAVAETLRTHPELGGSPAAQRMLRRRAYANVNVIDAGHAPGSGDHDFSYPGVMDRHAKGRAAAEQWLQLNLPESLSPAE
ncbi:patatin-like phospholipase family protein [Tropicimonas sp. IMCC34043]|uniref:patatin-like phospholipase family protein n=1 Tax=Tropicimonas sp. IMCC34043 TaxID=2248760 RepID=UPI000E26798A|nr:patatin-like phospholipase family protein [Tropicimonas sp. IMCC34043]